MRIVITPGTGFGAAQEHDKVLGQAIVDYVSDHTELYKQFFENPNFKKWLLDTIYLVTYDESAACGAGGLAHE